MAKRSDVKLQRETVVRAALDLLEETGVDGLTTRRIATALGVQQPALYWHFKDKAALLDALADAMILENHNHSLPQPGESWQEFFFNNARSFRRALLAYRDGARIHAGSRPSPAQFAGVETKIRFLVDAGFDVFSAGYAMRVTGHYVVGSVLEEQASLAESAHAATGNGQQDMHGMAAQYPLLAQVFAQMHERPADEGFEFGLAALIAGFERRRSAQ